MSPGSHQYLPLYCCIGVAASRDPAKRKEANGRNDTKLMTGTTILFPWSLVATLNTLFLPVVGAAWGAGHDLDIAGWPWPKEMTKGSRFPVVCLSLMLALGSPASSCPCDCSVHCPLHLCHLPVIIVTLFTCIVMLTFNSGALCDIVAQLYSYPNSPKMVTHLSWCLASLIVGGMVAITVRWTVVRN